LTKIPKNLSSWPLILGIETSCDETSASIYDTKNKQVLSNTTFSQIDIHKHFGGVIPEIASRAQLEKITPIIIETFEKANKTLEQIDAIAVSKNPGLPGSLLVGLCFAKNMAYGANKKIIGVNHLEAHAFSPMIENDIPFPHICLTASGGHTCIYLIKNFGEYEILGQTLDDAAGEAFDKIAKMLNLDYPGGPLIEKLASEVNFKDFYKYPRGKLRDLDFSFSGLKTAVLYDLVAKNAYDMQNKKFLGDNILENNNLISKNTNTCTEPNLEKIKITELELKQRVSSSLLVCISDIFKQRIKLALERYPEVKAVSMAGGVACNKYIKNQINNLCDQKKVAFYSPSPKYCTDNAAMVAFVGAYKYQQGKFDDLELDIFE
jgi:N6-L-threonylcarbamoyladenine synthase